MCAPSSETRLCATAVMSPLGTVHSVTGELGPHLLGPGATQSPDCHAHCTPCPGSQGQRRSPRCEELADEGCRVSPRREVSEGAAAMVGATQTEVSRRRHCHRHLQGSVTVWVMASGGVELGGREGTGRAVARRKAEAAGSGIFRKPESDREHQGEDRVTGVAGGWGEMCPVSRGVSVTCSGGSHAANPQPLNVHLRAYTPCPPPPAL